MSDDGDLRGERAAREVERLQGHQRARQRREEGRPTSTPRRGPAHLKDAAATAETWPNITEQKKALPGADDAAKEDNKIAALTLEGGG